MANVYNAGDSYFDIDTSANVADLVTLKGSAIASTDTVYIFNNATFTVESNINLYGFYTGDNFAGDAAVKTGHVSCLTAGVTINIYASTVNDGFSGEGSTSSYVFNSSGADIIVFCINTNRVTNLNVAQCDFTINNVKLQKTYRIYSDYPVLNITNASIEASSNALRITDFDIVNNRLDALTLLNCTVGIRVMGQFNWEDFFTRNEIKFEDCGINTLGPVDARYWYSREDAASIRSVCTWDTTTGIQALTASKVLTLSASWNGASHGTGDDVFYRIYIRAGSAPDSFGKDSVYFLAEIADTSFIIVSDATGSVLVDGTVYHVIIRACTNISDEETNTTALTDTADDAGVLTVNISLPVTSTVEKSVGVEVKT